MRVLRVSGRQHADSSSMKSALKAKNAQIRTTRPCIHHTAFQVLNLRQRPAPLQITIPEERRLERILIRARSTRHCLHLGHSGRCHRQQCLVELFDKIERWERAKRWPIDKSVLISRVPEHVNNSRMVVAKRQRSDLHEHVQEHVAVSVADVVSSWLVEISEEGYSAGILDLVYLLQECLGLGPWYWCLHDGRLGLVAVGLDCLANGGWIRLEVAAVGERPQAARYSTR